MGIYKFFAEYVVTLPKYTKPVKLNKLNEYAEPDAILIDANGILHSVAQRVFEYGDVKKIVKNKKTRTYEEYMALYKEELFKALDDAIFRKKPSDLVIIAVDGVAPAAKITQQRSRRYGSEGAVAGGVFDSSMITPGTDFMKDVDLMILEYVDFIENQFNRVIYSSFREPGEGEHKMFWIAKKHLNTGQLALVDGMDSDLFMLSLTANFTILLMRGDSFVDIDIYKQHIRTSLKAKERRLKYERVYEDFIIMLYLIGNDFLPKLDMVSNVGRMVELMTTIHLNLKKTISEGDGKIDHVTLSHFFSILAEIEIFALRNKTKDHLSYFYPHNVLHSEEVIENVNAESYMSLVTKKTFKKENPIDVAYDYLDGINWVFRYYTTQDRWSKLWIYNFDKAPFVVFLAKLTEKYKVPRDIYEKNDFLTVEQQLVSVIPPSSAWFIPKKIARYIEQGGELEDLAPQKTRLVLSGIMKEKDTFLGKRLLPKLDVKRVMATVKETY